MTAPDYSESDLKAADELLASCDGCLTGGQRVEIARFRAEGRREADDLLREKLNQFEAYGMPNVAAALDRIEAARAEGRREAGEEHKTLYASLRLDLQHTIEKREAAEARLREVDEARILNAKTYTEMLDRAQAKLAEVERERDRANQEAGHLRQTAQMRTERAEASEAQVQELQDWKDAHTLVIAGMGLEVRELRAALEGLLTVQNEVADKRLRAEAWTLLACTESKDT